MRSLFRSSRAARPLVFGGILVAAAGLLLRSPGDARPGRILRVCADPNNLPFSNNRLEGFENRIAELLAAELNAGLEYTWFMQRRGFVRNTLGAGNCDVMMGAPAGYDLAALTVPYYRSSYVFVYRKESGLSVSSLDDAVLRSVRIGVHVIGDDYTNTPPAHALARRGISSNIVGFRIQDDYSRRNPPARLIEAVANGEIDVAAAWGPTAGYFARQQRVPLEIVPVSPNVDHPWLPFTYAISMGVRRNDGALKQELDAVLSRRRADIRKILTSYGVPLS